MRKAAFALFSILFLFSFYGKAKAGSINYINLAEGVSALDISGRFVFGYDFGITDGGSKQTVGDVRFVPLGTQGAYAYLSIEEGVFHKEVWSKEDFMPPIAPGDPLEKILEDLIYRQPRFTLCHLTPGNRYKLQILIRHGTGDRPFTIAFQDGDTTEQTPAMDQGDGRTIPGLELPADNWAAAIVYDWEAQTDALKIAVSGEVAHLYGMTLEDLSGGHQMVNDPRCPTAALLPSDTFPRFIVPDLEQEMGALRELFWRHYINPIRGCTLWQDWMTYAALWPLTSAAEAQQYNYRPFHRNFLLNADFDEWGCVATHQHASYAHRDGWPFPTFEHSMGKGAGWVRGNLGETAGWSCVGATALKEGEGEVWSVEIAQPGAYLLSPELAVDAFNAPFVEIRWKRKADEGGDPYLEWTTEEEPDFSPERRMRFPGAEHDRGKGSLAFASIPLYRHPLWKGTIKRIRVFPAPDASSGKISINAIMTQYDTRHTINNSNFVLGCRNYFVWTGELDFLRANLGRMRTAMQWLQQEAGGLEHGCILDPLPGHDGRPGYTGPPGQRVFRPGHGVGSNYWDILPFGHFDCYSSNYYYKSLLAMAEIEEAVGRHPSWNLPAGGDAFDPQELRKHAERVRRAIQKKFWDNGKGRFVGWIDADGNRWDYGFIFLNLELIESGVASEKQARTILDWISGRRIIEGETSTGEDIYRWRLAPRATTLRNIECYQWVWQAPESIPFGGQVQDGGAVLGFSHHDLMSRLKVAGPDDAWARLREILAWYREVMAEGGYRAYYAAGDKGTTMQGAGVAGGIGIDLEFIESLLVPQVMLYGFLGLNPGVDGIEISPCLPSDWPSLQVTNISCQGMELDVTAGRETVVLAASSSRERELNVNLPGADWRLLSASGEAKPEVEAGQARFRLLVEGRDEFRFRRGN